jgi:hypothetical protein
MDLNAEKLQNAFYSQIVYPRTIVTISKKLKNKSIYQIFVFGTPYS